MHPTFQFYLREHTDRVPGAVTKLADIYQSFLPSLAPEERAAWSRTRIRAELAYAFPIGRREDRCLYVGNLIIAGTTWERRGDQLVKTPRAPTRS